MTKYLCPNCNVKVEWKKTGKTVFDMRSQEEKEFVKCTRCGFRAMRTKVYEKKEKDRST